MRRLLVLATCFLGLTGVSFADAGSGDPSSARAFNRWIESDKIRASEFRAFERFLQAEGVASVVPAWQLLRVDAHYAARCNAGYFAIPPRAKWGAIVPALRLVRDEVVPVTGPVEVSSAWRSPEINSCVNGASRSRHLQFRALDLVATKRADRTKLFSDLCRLQSRVGARKSMGLGAYFDPADTKRNTRGRFHIDASGYRTWGFDYTSKSNPCPRLF